MRSSSFLLEFDIAMVSGLGLKYGASPDPRQVFPDRPV